MMTQTHVLPVRTNHALHAVLTALTCGLWLPVWVVLAIVNNGRTKVVNTWTVTDHTPSRPVGAYTDQPSSVTQARHDFPGHPPHPQCTRPTYGWFCPLAEGHEGPCPATPTLG